MKIRKITLNGYKRFKSLTIDLGETPRRIIALVGPNGCGKSSVLDGMLFLSNFFGPIGNKENKDFHYHSIEQVPSYNWEKIKIEFSEGDYHVIRESKRQIGKENTIFSFRSPYRYNNNLKVKEARSVSELRLNNYGATYTADLDDKMEENYRRLSIKYNRYLKETDCRPSEARQKIIGDLNRAIQHCLDLKIVDLGDIEDDKGTLYFSKSDYSTSFEYNVLSSGEKEVVDILLDLYLRQDEYDDTIFLIDEPELHINTSIQRKLLLEINKLIGPNCQIWVATHSIGFLRALQDELKDDCQVIEFEQGVKWASEEQVLNPMIKSHAQWKKIFATALDDLASLICPKVIVYCEGMDKPGKNGIEKGLDATVFNRIFNEKYPDVLFVSSGGNTELDQRSDIAFLILSKVFADLEIWVFKDRDMGSGKTISEEERLEYLRNNKHNHRVMKRWEIENYLYDKEVLKKYCIEHASFFDEEQYDNFVTDIVNQNLKDETGRIKKICGINYSVNAEVFKKNLSECVTSDMQVYKELEDCIFNRK